MCKVNNQFRAQNKASDLLHRCQLILHTPVALMGTDKREFVARYWKIADCSSSNCEEQEYTEHIRVYRLRFMCYHEESKIILAVFHIRSGPQNPCYKNTDSNCLYSFLFLVSSYVPSARKHKNETRILWTFLSKINMAQ